MISPADYRQFVAENVRLIILRALAEENDYTLNESLIRRTLETFGHIKGRDYVRAQLVWLAEEAGAISLSEAGSIMIATLTRAGLEHVERRQILPGVERPSPGG